MYYELITKKEFNNNLIFKVNDIEYTVEDFYKDQSSANGLTVIVDYLKLQYVNQYKDLFYTAEEIEDFEESIDNAVKSFEKGEKDIMEEPPRSPDEPLFDKSLITWGLWIIGPSVHIFSPFDIKSYNILTARLTPKQKPAVLAKVILTCILFCTPSREGQFYP